MVAVSSAHCSWVVARYFYSELTKLILLSLIDMAITIGDSATSATGSYCSIKQRIQQGRWAHCKQISIIYGNYVTREKCWFLNSMVYFLVYSS
jgi:hypothetical protein